MRQCIIAAPYDTVDLHRILSSLEGRLQFFPHQEQVKLWHNEQIHAGEKTAQVMQEHIQAAQLIILLMSRKFLEPSFYKNPENQIDLIAQRSQLERDSVIPILVKPSSWDSSPFRKIRPLPSNETTLQEIRNKEQWLQNVSVAIMDLIETRVASLPAFSPPLAKAEATHEPVSFPSSSFVHGHALLIGTGGDLRVTIDDAQRLRRVLTEAAAYPSTQVELLLDTQATRDNILAAFDRLIARVKDEAEATAIVYFSGYGIKYSQGGQPDEYYLIPYNYSPSLRPRTALSGDEFTAKIEAITARKRVVFLDCCHAGGIPQLKDGVERVEKSPLPDEFVHRLSSGSGKVVMTSCHEQELSQTNAYGSIFTNCLLEALLGKAPTQQGQEVRILDVLTYIFREVPLRTRSLQRPYLNEANLGDNFVLCYVNNHMNMDHFLSTRRK